MACAFFLALDVSLVIDPRLCHDRHCTTHLKNYWDTKHPAAVAAVRMRVAIESCLAQHVDAGSAMFIQLTQVLALHKAFAAAE